MSDDTKEQPVSCRVQGKFQKGKSGNPRGRPRGSKNKSTILREQMEKKTHRMISKEVPEVLAVVLQAAKDGDMSAAKMILDRAIPVHKATEGEAGAAPQVSITITNLTSPHEEDQPGYTIEGQLDG